MVFPLDVPFQLVAIEIDVAQIAGAVAHCLIVEMRRPRIAALSARGDGLRAHAIAELDDGDEAVAGGPVDLFGSPVAAGAERRERSPARRSEADRNARPRIAERMHDVVGDPLEPVDVAPRRLPRTEVIGELFGRRR